MTPTPFTILVRHNSSNAVNAKIQEVSNGYLLVAVTKKNCLLPQVGHLLGIIFPDIAAIRNSLVAAMKDVGDTLDHVLLTTAIYIAWQEHAVNMAKKAIALGVSPEDIPDEMAKALPGGYLLIWVDVPKVGRVELKVPPGEWDWANGKRPN